LTGLDAPTGTPAAVVTSRAAVLYAEYQRTRDIQLIDTVIDPFREAVALAEVGHPDRPKYLSNLGAALYTRFEGTG
jgi:hypothetical protein